MLTQLRQCLQQPLPGRAAQAKYEPGLSYGRHYDRPPASARQAAVAVLLYPQEGRWWLPLTVRPETMSEHAGQISLPGGMVEPGEESSQAALRELWEELGVAAGEVELLGKLSPLYLYVSNFAVQPWVAAARHRPQYVPNLAEVAELLEVPLLHLCDPSSCGRRVWQRRGIDFSAPSFDWQGHSIWGATCMILGELAAVVGEVALTDLRSF